MARLILPKRKATSHKRENGTVLIVGGSEEITGAVALAGLAALRSGADLVTIAAPAKVAWAINCLSADLMTRKLEGTHLSLHHYKYLQELAKNADVLLFGNGAWNHPETARLMRKLATLPNKKVIDADALKVIRSTGVHDAILTPHQREWELFLANCSARERGQPAAFFARNNVVLLKGHVDVLMTSAGVERIRGGNPGMTRGGTGDVLAGLVASLWAQGLTQEQAARSASILNKRIGDALLRKHKGYTYLASDMVAEIERLTRLRNR